LPPEARSLGVTEFKPVLVTQPADGLALSVGPDVTEHPALVPGTAVTPSPDEKDTGEKIAS